MTYSVPLNTAYRSSDTELEAEFSYLIFVLNFLSFFGANPADIFTCVTDHTYQSWLIKEKMADKETKSTMREFATNDQVNYYSGITSITVNGKNAYEIKGKFLDDLHKNAFSGTNGEDAVEHIEYFLRIVDPIDLPNVNQDKLRVVVFPISLVDLTAIFFRKYYLLSRTRRVNTRMIKWEPTNQKFKNWLASKFINYKTMDIFTKGAFWDHWKLGSDEIEPTDEKFLYLEKNTRVTRTKLSRSLR
ncbi:hypothetical protein Tco_0615443 [Tanacetum coccineum]